MDTNIDKLQKAEKTIRLVRLLTFCVAAFSLAIALISMRNMHPSAYTLFEYCSFAHFGVMVLFGIAFKLKSRAFTILFLIYYILSRMILAVCIALSHAAFTVDFFIGLAFIAVICYGLGATFQYQRIMKNLGQNLPPGVQNTNAVQI